MAIEKIIALDNIDNVVNSEGVDTVVEMDVDTAAAYQQSQAAAEHVTEVLETLEKTAECVSVESPEEPKVKENNMYTKLTLDESIDNFVVKEAKTRRTEDEADRYTEYDMYDFIYSLFSSESDSLVRPLKALSNIKTSRGRKKKDDKDDNDKPSFMYQGSDDYNDETGDGGVKGVSQISSDPDGNVVLYKDSKQAFDAVIALCDEYKFKYDGPREKRAPWVRWNYSMIIFVPVSAAGYPMEVEDYFESIGIPIEDVMPKEFINGRTRDYKRLNDETVVEVTLSKYIRKAGNSNDPLEGFLKDMFKELNSAGVKYDKQSLKKRFLDEFQDDFEDDDE